MGGREEEGVLTGERRKVYWLERGGSFSDGREEEGVLVGERRKVF